MHDSTAFPYKISLLEQNVQINFYVDSKSMPIK